MNTDSSSPATRRSWSRLFWAAGGVLAVSIGSFMLLVREAESSDRFAGVPLSAAPAAAGPNRIDHSQFDRDGLAQPTRSEPATKQSGGALPSIGALKSEYLRCEYIASQRRLSMHGLVFCKAVSDQLLKREFGGDLDLLLAWRSADRQASAKGIDRQRTPSPPLPERCYHVHPRLGNFPAGRTPFAEGVTAVDREITWTDDPNAILCACWSE